MSVIEMPILMIKIIKSLYAMCQWLYSESHSRMEFKNITENNGRNIFMILPDNGCYKNITTKNNYNCIIYGQVKNKI